MTRAFIDVPKSVGVTDLPEGGAIRSAGDNVAAPQQLSITRTGVAFGPVHLGVPEGGVCNLETMTFLPSDDDGGLLALTAGGAAGTTAAVDDETDLPTPSRRGILTFIGAILAAGAASTSAQGASDDELVTLSIAEFSIASPDVPVTVRVLDFVDAVLPPTTDILVDQKNARVGEIVKAGEPVTLRQVGGPVEIYLRDTRAKLAKLLAWAKSFVPKDSSLTYRRTLPGDKKASEFLEGEFVRLTSHPSIIGPVEDTDADRTVLTIGQTTIPHEDDGASEAGVWAILDGTLVYEVGANPPAVAEWELQTRLNAWQAFRS